MYIFLVTLFLLKDGLITREKLEKFVVYNSQSGLLRMTELKVFYANFLPYFIHKIFCSFVTDVSTFPVSSYIVVASNCSSFSP